MNQNNQGMKDVKATSDLNSVGSNNKWADKKESVSHKVGDSIERAGDKLKDMGATKMGQAVHNAGDKIEHANDRKNK